MDAHGHLFVIQADLTRLAADAFLVPCDNHANVSGAWRPFVEPDQPAQPKENWFVPTDAQPGQRFTILPPRTIPDTQGPDAVWGRRVLVDTVGVQSIDEMIDNVLLAVEEAAKGLERHDGRVVPLIALPVMGVGQGRFRRQRATVVRRLVERLGDFVRGHSIDVVLVAQRASDYAAAQWAREQLTSDQTCWPVLSSDLLQLADDLGLKAANGELSLFIGAGASTPVGFPDWRTLLTELAGKELQFTAETDYPKLAESLHIANLENEVAGRFGTRKHALGHSLLVGLRTQAMVTTNYDPCLENAAEAIHGPDRLKVLARQLATGSRPWLLKIHGDLRKPETIVLRESQYQRLQNEWAALRGVVQSLMLTSHLLFVGFGFAESDFLAMSQAVQDVRKLASDTPLGKAGTAVQLVSTKGREDKYPDLAYHAIEANSVQDAARLLEIWLDRLAWRCQVAGRGRALFLLDPNYADGASEADKPLIETLGQLARSKDSWAESAGAQSVQELLTELGYRDQPETGVTAR